MTDILNLTYSELEHFLTQEMNERPFRAKQLWQWLWQKGVTDFESMTDVSKATRTALEQRAFIRWPEIAETHVSADGTTKFLLRLADGALIETVLIPGARGRLTQCLSSQVGCAMGCTFCGTGALGFERNMTMGEILGQVLVARRYLDELAQQGLPMPGTENPENNEQYAQNAPDGISEDWETDPDDNEEEVWTKEKPDNTGNPLKNNSISGRYGRDCLRNLVFMGMGEPLLNLRNVMRALETLNSGTGLNFSPRRITISTCGLREGLKELGDSGLAYLAVSLHAPNQALRAKIMPKAARWPLEEFMDALAAYPLKTRERLTFEYLLLGGVNDSIEHAKELVRLISRVRGKLNLIVYNPTDGLPYQAPTEERILAFEQYLWSKNITAIIRKSKGQDIKAACGQLKAQAVREGGIDAGSKHIFQNKGMSAEKQ